MGAAFQRNRYWWYRSLYGIGDVFDNIIRWLRWSWDEASLRNRCRGLGSSLLVRTLLKTILDTETCWTEELRKATLSECTTLNGVPGGTGLPILWCTSNSSKFLKDGKSSMRSTRWRDQLCSKEPNETKNITFNINILSKTNNKTYNQ